MKEKLKTILICYLFSRYVSIVKLYKKLIRNVHKSKETNVYIDLFKIIDDLFETNFYLICNNRNAVYLSSMRSVLSHCYNFFSLPQFYNTNRSVLKIYTIDSKYSDPNSISM